MTTRNQSSKMLGQIIARALNDESFKRRLLADTGAVLREGGVDIPKGMEVRAVENTDHLTHIVIPVRPVSEKVSEEIHQLIITGCNCWQGEAWN